MTQMSIEGGTLTASKDDRVVSGLLVKFNEEGRTNLGRIRVPKGAFHLPEDVPSFLHLVDTHARPIKAVGTGMFAQETEDGIYAAWRIHDGETGDALLAALADPTSGYPRKLSIEVDGVKVRNGVVTAGNVHGAALVPEGAFPSSSLMAADVGPDDDEDEEPPAAEARRTVSELRDEDGNAVGWMSTSPDGTRTVALNAPTQTTDEEPSSDEETPEAPAEKESEADVASVPNTLTASADKKEPSFSQVVDMIHTTRSGAADETLMAALSDIKISGTGALPSAGVLQPAWLGEIWAEKGYTRRYMPLIRNGNITAIDEKGFVVDQGSELVQTWAGNKAELPTGTGTTSILTSTFQRWGFAVDIAREFFDIPSARPVVEAFLRKVAISYARVTDVWTLAQVYAAAGTQVDADTYPADYNNSLGKLIQAIDTVDDTDIEPAWVIVAPDVYTELRFTPKDLIPEYVSFSFGRQGGTADGITVVRDKSGTLDAGQVLAGGRDVAHVNELGGAAPLQIDALDLARGGVDKAVIGYTQYMTEYADGLVLIGDPVV